MTTYFFDVTDILLYVEKETTVSGIQRVSFEVIRRMVEQCGPDRVRLSYWDRHKREYLSIPSHFVVEMNAFDPDIFSAVFFGKSARPRDDTPPTLERYRNRPAKYWFHYLRSSYHALRGNEPYFDKHNTTIADWYAFKSTSTTEPKAHDLARTPVKKIAQPDDQLIALGAIWAIDGLEACLGQLKEQHGVKISQLLHDLIPIMIPEHLAENFSREFYRWLKATSVYCDRYFANSANTARDLQTFLDEIGVQRQVQTVPLAQQFSISDPKSTATPPPKGSIKARVEQSQTLRLSTLNLTKTPFVLVVGTIETRKNVWRLAQAWQRLAQDPDIEVPKLVFAGKAGWAIDDFNKLMEGTGNLGGWVQFVDRPSDTELAFLYENCLFTAMVSFYEGWGLPIGESLSFGKTAVVADNSSMPEVGGDMVEYCDAQSLHSIYAACRKLIAEPDHREALEARIAATKLRTWNDVASDFVDHLSK